MGKYWYRDHENKWRQGDDTDDFAVAILMAIFFGLGWIVWKPISWWLLKREKPTEKWITIWAIVTFVVLFLIIYLCV